MPQFELLVGRHVEGKGEDKKVYEAGKGRKRTLINSPHDLDKMFAEKFRRVDGPTKKPQDRHDGMDDNGKVSDEPLHKKLKHAEKKAGPQKKAFKSSDYAAETDDDGDEVYKDDDEGISEVSGAKAMKARRDAVDDSDEDSDYHGEESDASEIEAEEEFPAEADEDAPKPKKAKRAKKTRKSH